MLEHAELSPLDLAVCLEPWDNRLQLGCWVRSTRRVPFEGRTAHSARPWEGENAIPKAARFLQELAERAPRDAVIYGFTFREVMSPTLAQGGRGRNIVPDASS